MFTGIVTTVGQIIEVSRLQQSAQQVSRHGVRLRVHAPGLQLNLVNQGDSIAINGACMTVVAIDGEDFWVDVSAESLSCTVGLDSVGAVNLEKALRLKDYVGGHFVTGHVDGLAYVEEFTQFGESWHLVVRVPTNLSRYVAHKGSITLNGVSLTVNQVVDGADGCQCHINLIPHTLVVTTLGQLKIGLCVNLEVDLIARYVERMLSTVQGGSKSL